MIPRDYITEWRSQAPWVQDIQVEQDLVICRALVEIFAHPVLSKAVALRGGTALYKLYIKDPQFTADISPLLANGHSWEMTKAADEIAKVLIQKLPGDPWKGGG